jgi:hypothetical protein
LAAWRKEKSARGFQTGDLAAGLKTKGKNQGRHVGRVVVRKSGYFDISTKGGKVSVS